MNTKYFWDCVSLSVVGIVAYPLLRLASTLKLQYLYIIIGLVLADYATKIVKNLTKDYDHDFLKRPKNALDCDFFCKNGDCEGNPGMPSGHMALTTFGLTIFFLMDDVINKQIYIVFACVFICLMAAARYNKKCHNVAQIAAGTIWGFAFALLFYCVIHKIL